MRSARLASRSRNRRAALAMGVAFGGSLVWAATVAQAGPALAPGSPLATDGKRLFAVAADTNTLVTRPIEGATRWVPLAGAPPLSRVDGLAATKEALFASDSGSRSILRIPFDGGAPKVWIRGNPLAEPSELAAAGDAIFVADAGARSVFRASLRGEPGARPEIERLALDVNPPVFLAFSGESRLLVSSPDSNLLLRVARASGSAQPKLSTIQGRVGNEVDDPDLSRGSASSDSRPRQSYRGEPSGEFPPIPGPLSISAWKGIVYVVSSDGQVYVTPRLYPRAVPIPRRGLPVERPTRVLATSKRLFVLDGASGDVVSMSRPVPTEFVIEAKPSECTAAVLRYLGSAGTLPTAHASFDRSFEHTLQQAKVLERGWVDAMNNVVCDLNPKLCTQSERSALPRTDITAGTDVEVPNLFSETKLVYRHEKIPDHASVGEWVDQNVTWPRFLEERGGAMLCNLNPASQKQLPDCVAAIRGQRGGSYVLPREVVRYVALVPAEDVDGGQIQPRLAAVKKACPEILINPLEQRMASRKACPAPEALAAWPEVDRAYEKATREVIHYPKFKIPVAAAPQVGIAERPIDLSHPDLLDAAGRLPFVGVPDVTPAAGAPPAFSVRRFDLVRDHGTAVAYLIAGQRRRGTAGLAAGLAPAVRLLPLTTELNLIHSDYANSPYGGPRTKIVNLSLSSRARDGDDGLRQLVKDNDFALFVAAAGNSRETIAEREVCSDPAHFLLPACLGRRRNVIVVAATTADGKRILDVPKDEAGAACDEGSFHSTEYVHVAAPGDGYYAAGSDGSYVPVRGTSFATPLVTATAALILQQGVASPVAIKRRIIAASEPFEDERESKKVLGGLLDVERAVRWPSHTTLVPQGGQPRRAEVVLDGDPTIAFIASNAERRRIRLSQILRARRLDANNLYWVAYVDDDETVYQDVRITRLRVPSGQGFTYQPLDDAGTPVGTRLTKNLDEFDDFIAPLKE